MAISTFEVTAPELQVGDQVVFSEKIWTVHQTEQRQRLNTSAWWLVLHNPDEGLTSIPVSTQATFPRIVEPKPEPTVIPIGSTVHLLGGVLTPGNGEWYTVVGYRGEANQYVLLVPIRYRGLPPHPDLVTYTATSQIRPVGARDLHPGWPQYVRSLPQVL